MSYRVKRSEFQRIEMDRRDAGEEGGIDKKGRKWKFLQNKMRNVNANEKCIVYIPKITDFPLCPCALIGGLVS